ARLESFLGRLPPAPHASFGHWLFWTPGRASVFADLRDPEPAAALGRLRAALDPDSRARLEALVPRLAGARPWAAEREAGGGLRLYWLPARHAAVETVVERLAPGAWRQV